jgi:DNA-binding transcriptional MerR regulator/methylmalonyl-CoA mutase cobalamin-binding subunit
MPIDVKRPAFNLKVVVQETGLKPDTLRVWERRYGLPQPQRSAGRHRLYSQQDIDTLKWLVARQNEGLSISRAVALWRQLEAEGQKPLEQEPQTAPVFKPALAPTVGQTLIELREAWIAACMAFDEQMAAHMLTQAFALYPPEVTCTELLLPALADIGAGWFQGHYTVQQEHFASALAARRLEALLAATPAPTRPGRFLVGCPPQEEHTLGLLMLSLFLRRQGWDVIYLGANVPIAQLETTIAATKPQLVILSAQRLTTAATLQEMAQFLVEKHIPLAYGGQIFNSLPALQERIAGHYLGTNVNEAAQIVEHLLASSPPIPQAEPISDIYQQALDYYSQQQPLVDAAVWEAWQSTDISEDHHRLVDYNLSRNIIAALTMGDIAFVSRDLVWVKNLLVNYQLPADSLCAYLNAYHQAVETQLDDRGTPVKMWLAQVIANSEQVQA